MAREITTSFINNLNVKMYFERPTWDEYFMIQAELIRLRSNCIIKQTGAVIVQNNRQIATGYNGTPPGITNCFDGGCKKCIINEFKDTKQHIQLDRCLCTHAESNAIMHCSLMGIKTGKNDAILYSTYSPCSECIKMAITVGIRKFVCYHSSEINHELLEQTSIEIIKLDKKQIQHWIEELIKENESK